MLNAKCKVYRTMTLPMSNQIHDMSNGILECTFARSKQVWLNHMRYLSLCILSPRQFDVTAVELECLMSA